MIRKMLVATAFAIPLFCIAASAQSVDDVINKNLDARGGREKLKAISSVIMTGTSTVGPGLQAATTIKMKRPANVRFELTVQGMAVVQATDGSTAWMVNPLNGGSTPQTMSAEDAADINEDADLDGVLVDYKAKGHTVELLGKEDLEGSPAYKLKVTLKSGDVQYIYLDAGTYLELKTVSKRHQQGQEIEVEAYPSNYKPVEGVLFPFNIESKAAGQTVFSFVASSIEVNKPIDDAVFKQPAK